MSVKERTVAGHPAHDDRHHAFQLGRYVLPEQLGHAGRNGRRLFVAPSVRAFKRLDGPLYGAGEVGHRRAGILTRRCRWRYEAKCLRTASRAASSAGESERMAPHFLASHAAAYSSGGSMPSARSPGGVTTVPKPYSQ